MSESGSGTGSMVPGPGSPPMGLGSARLTAPSSSDGIALFTPGYNGVRLDQITKLRYSTYRTSGGTAQAISLQFEIDNDVTDNDNAWKGRLVFEPYYTETVLTGTWQTWDPMTQGKWWFTRPPMNATCSQLNPCTWAQVLSHFPNAGIHSVFGAVILKAGSGWSNFDGNVDALTIGVNGSDTTYDFEPSPPTKVWVDHDGTVDVANNSCNGSDAAYTSIQNAIYNVTPGGSVVVCPGTYGEELYIDKDLTLQGIENPVVEAPDTLTDRLQSLPRDIRAVVFVTGTVTVNIDGFVVDGRNVGNNNGGLAGVVYYGASGSLKHSEVRNISDSPISGVQHGNGVVVTHNWGADLAHHVTVDSNWIHGYQKNGITCNEPGASCTVLNNTVTGSGPHVPIAQNGIQIGFGASFDRIEGNVVTDHIYTQDASKGWVSTGILIYQADLPDKPLGQIQSYLVRNNAVFRNQANVTVIP